MCSVDCKSHRHPKELFLFGMATLLTIVVFVGLFVLSFYPDEVKQMIDNDIVESVLEREPKLKGAEVSKILDRATQSELDSYDILPYVKPLFGAFLFPVVLVLFVAFLIYSIGIEYYGNLRSNSVLVTQKQFPVVYRMFHDLAKEMGFQKIPELYLVNGNGQLNAYAVCVPGYRNFSAVYSDIVEAALRKNDLDALRFILAHELGHIRYHHVSWWWIALKTFSNFPFINYVLGLPLSRAQEYSCDKLAYKINDDKGHQALMMLAAGKHLYDEVDMQEYLEQQKANEFWASVRNFIQDHAVIRWRIEALINNKAGALVFPKKFLRKNR